MKVINQKLNEFANDCTIASIMQIIHLQYWIQLKYSWLDKTIDLALKMKVLFKGWAVFETIYNWYSKRIHQRLWIFTEVYKINMYSKEFENLYKQDIYFWIWIRRGNKKYLEYIKNEILTMSNMKDISEYYKKWFNHNSVVGNEKYFEVYWGIKWKLWYSVLKKGMDLGVYWSIARTIIPKWRFSKLVSRNLRKLKDNPKYIYIGKSKFEAYAYRKAVDIRREFNS